MNLDQLIAESSATNPQWLMRVAAPPHATSAAAIQAVSTWTGGIRDRVPCVSNQFQANETERNLIQQLGNAVGCHTCGRGTEELRNFIVDHIPPKALAGDGARYRFYAHCYECANTQASLVRSVLDSPYAQQIISLLYSKEKSARTVLESFFNTRELALITGGADAQSIEGQYAGPSRQQQDDINRIGVCHSCGTDRPAKNYHADHCPPAAIAMVVWLPTYVDSLIAELNSRTRTHANDTELAKARSLKALLDNKYFRPQCPACSHSQGSRVNSVLRQAQASFAAHPPMTARKTAVHNYKQMHNGY